MTQIKFSYAVAPTVEAQKTMEKLSQRYPHHAVEQADIIVTLGGDGFMLHTLHRYKHLEKPVYGLNCGRIGFLMNRNNGADLMQRVQHAKLTKLHPLKMIATCTDGKTYEQHAINEVSLLRQTHQTAKITIEIDDKIRLETLVADGVLVATAAGSTAYNLSAHGPIIPIGTKLLALTPISAFRPRRWRGALIPDTATIRFLIQNSDQRPVAAVADYREVRDVTEVRISQDCSVCHQLLFDPDHNLEDRILGEQFI